MQKMSRILALLLCLVLLGTCVFSSVPTAMSAETEAAAEPLETAETAAPEGDEPAETEPEPFEPTEEEAAPQTEPAETELVETEPAETELVETEPALREPVVTEPVETEPVVTEPVEPEPVVTEPTEPPEPPVSEMTDEQIIAKYAIPDDWARNAMVFAVRYGILSGKGDNDLAPKDNTKHSELATILMSILKTHKTASLDRFTDVKSSSWYYPAFGKAVSLGIFPIADPNATTLTPHKYITREEAFVALARMFGVHGDSKQAIYSFNDWKDVSPWAATDLAAMIEICHISGTDGNLNPQHNITRREFVRVLSRLLSWIGTELPQQNCTGSMGLGSANVPKNTSVTGDLLLSTDETDLRLEGLTVTGRLILQGNGRAVVRLTNCKIQEIVACRPVELRLEGGSVKLLTVHNVVTLYGSVTGVKCFKTLIVAGGSVVNTINMMNNTGMTVAANALVRRVNVFGNDVYINGSGKIETLEQRGQNLTNLCQTDSVISHPFNTVNSVTATRVDKGTATESAPNLTMRLRLSNMPLGWSEVDLIWYVDGKEISRSSRNLLQEGSEISASANFSSYMDGLHSTVPFTVYITIDGKQALLYRGEVNVSESVARIAATVRTQNVQGYAKAGGILYSDSSLTSKTGAIAANTQFTILMSSSSRATKIRLQDGTVAWTNYYNVGIVSGSYYTTKDYSTAVKEYYVNNIRQWSSSKGYMIWVSLYTQRVNIFQGYKGHWRLIRSGPIGSGRNDCPTPVEDVSLQYHTTWYYPAPGHNPPFYCHHVTVFDNARGFHSRPTKWGEPVGSILYAGIGYPCSAGCIRLLDEDCIFIHDVLPLGTAVHIY